jgi:hypothetical protein
MLFKDILNQFDNELKPAMEELFQKALESQKHQGNLLLMYLNGWYDKTILEINERNGLNVSPYQIGIGYIGLSDQTHYKFIDEYRKNNISEINSDKYLEYLNKGEKDEFFFKTEKDEFSFNIETLIYLKIWENDLFLKTWYQFSKIINGEDYEWDFILKDFGNGDGLMTRPNLIREVLKKVIGNYSPIFKKHAENGYIQQVRNAIAHSNYYLFGRQITLTNFKVGDENNFIEKLTFEEWSKMFHSSIMLHNYFLWLNLKIDDYYTQLYLKTGNPIEVVCNHHGPSIIANYIKDKNSQWVSKD